MKNLSPARRHGRRGRQPASPRQVNRSAGQQGAASQEERWSGDRHVSCASVEKPDAMTAMASTLPARRPPATSAAQRAAPVGAAGPPAPAVFRVRGALGLSG